MKATKIFLHAPNYRDVVKEHNYFLLVISRDAEKEGRQQLFLFFLKNKNPNIDNLLYK